MAVSLSLPKFDVSSFVESDDEVLSFDPPISFSLQPFVVFAGVGDGVAEAEAEEAEDGDHEEGLVDGVAEDESNGCADEHTGCGVDVDHVVVFFCGEAGDAVAGVRDADDGDEEDGHEEREEQHKGAEDEGEIGEYRGLAGELQDEVGRSEDEYDEQQEACDEAADLVGDDVVDDIMAFTVEG